MSTCELYENCPFYETVTVIDRQEEILNEYFRIYCNGPMQEFCQRKKGYERAGKKLAPSMSPSGLDLKIFCEF